MLLLGYCDLWVIAGVSLFYEVYFKRLSRAFKVRDGRWFLFRVQTESGTGRPGCIDKVLFKLIPGFVEFFKFY